MGFIILPLPLTLEKQEDHSCYLTMKASFLSRTLDAHNAKIISRFFFGTEVKILKALNDGTVVKSNYLTR